MARRRNAGPALIVNREAEYREIKEWYRDRLSRTVPPRGFRYDPVKIGPSWQWNEKDGWLLPELTIGWDQLAWAGVWLNSPNGGPWAYTMEQARLVLHMKAVDGDGKFVYDHSVIQRLKGWGKDPFGSVGAACAMVGPAVPEFLPSGELRGRPEPNAWIQIAAVSQDQTKNTMKLFPSLFSEECRRFYGVQVGKVSVWAMGDTRQIEAVTSNYLAIEGGRPTFVICNETQNWNASNGGHEMYGAIDGNATKATFERPAQVLDICNAYVPGRDSVGQRTREAWEGAQGDTGVDNGILYDSLEAPEVAPLTAEALPHVINAVRGDSVWLDPERIVKSVLKAQNSPSESRRKWYNQIEGAEDSWTIPREWDHLKDESLVVDASDEVVLFFDGGKSDDATAIVGCRVLDGHVFTVGMWQRPPGRRGDGWVAPRETIDLTVRAFLDSHNVVGFWCDPSHTRDDETMALFWDGIIDGWHRDYKTKLRLWAKPGKTGHACMWDMSDPKNSALFVEQVGRVLAEIQAGEFTHDNDIRLRNHVLNARRMPTKWGVSIAKNNRESSRKIDLAVAMVGARLIRRLYLNTRNVKKGGGIW